MDGEFLWINEILLRVHPVSTLYIARVEWNVIRLKQEALGPPSMHPPFPAIFYSPLHLPSLHTVAIYESTIIFT